MVFRFPQRPVVRRTPNPPTRRPPANNKSINTAVNSDIHPLGYITANRFYVEIESQLTAWFSSCQGLSVKNDTTMLPEGGLIDQQRILLGSAKFTEVTLSRGMTDNLLFWDWLQRTFRGGTNIRRSINILTFNQAGETMQCWTLIGAVPTNWKTPQLQATSTNLAIEELTLAFEGLKLTAKSGGGGATMLNNRDSLGFFG